MKKYFSDIIESPQAEITTLSLIIQLYLFRTSVPEFKYPFIILFTIFFIQLILSHKKIFLKNIRLFFTNYILAIILFIVLIIAFVFSDKLYLAVFKDVINGMILFLIFFSILIIVKSRKELNLFMTTFIKIVILFALLISIIRLFGLLAISQIQTEDYLKIDKNFALLPAFYGVISVLFLFTNKISKLKVLFYTTLISIISLNIILSGSRRGLIVFGLIVFGLIFLQLFQYIFKLGFLKNLFINSRIFLISLIIIIISGNLFVFHTGCSFKNSVLETIGSKDYWLAKKNISVAINNCISVVNKNIDYTELHEKIWFSKMDSRDPDCGWGFGDCKKVFPLKGDNAEIIPEKAIGCLIDLSSYDSLNRSWRSKYVQRIKVNKNDKYRASLYCFVSKDFSQSSIRLIATWKSAITEDSKAKSIAHYDIERKGTWQKLEIEFECNEGFVPIILYIGNWGKKNTYPMKGHFIIAYPKVDKIDSIKTNLASINFYLINAVILKISDKDPIRNLAAKFISEDTTYYGYKSDLFVDTISSKFTGSRLMRWQFALQIFTKEYNLHQKIFGGGFNFLNWYGDYFLGEKTKSDYPHNPFLHILLYSGIFGLLLYMFFMYKVFYYYIKYLKEYYILFIFFLITFFFTFFSGGNPFDPPMMGFFVILPFFIHIVHKNSISE